MSEVFQIPVLGAKHVWSVRIVPVAGAYFSEADAAEADRHAESKWQLREGDEYEFEFLDQSLYFGEHESVSPNSGHPYRGRLRTGNLVGRLKLDVYLNYTREKCGYVEFEVTSRKLDYRSDYRQMLDDIARRATDLLFSAQEAVQQTVSVDVATDSSTLYQRFAFLRAILESDRFTDALAKICAAPIRNLVDEEREGRPEQLRRVTASVARQIARAGGHPRWVTDVARVETSDVDENRFVKHVLGTFADFLRELCELKGAGEVLVREARVLCEKLDRALAEPFFRQVSSLTRLPLGSTALQRKEGYRDILKAWTIWDAAAKLAWKNGETVYDAGKKNVAALYEYWCYFKLLEVVQKLFNVSESEIAKGIIVSNDQGLTLSLKEGKRSPLHGRFRLPQEDGRFRNLEIDFNYNETFSRPQGGSWTLPMRPDYTLAFRPEGMTLVEASANDLVTYVHFDAKYKFDEIEYELNEIESGTNDGVEDETPQQRTARDVKRVDVLKMHAYRDAIRRTGGAYILYPGNQAKMPSRLYDEILPGLGAFPLSPSLDSSAEIERFLTEVATHLSDRITKWEAFNAQRKAIYDGTIRPRFITLGHIKGFVEAVSRAGVLPYRVSSVDDPNFTAQVRWFVALDDRGVQRVFRVKQAGCCGQKNLCALHLQWPAFRGVLLSGPKDALWQVFAVSEET